MSCDLIGLNSLWAAGFNSVSFIFNEQTFIENTLMFWFSPGRFPLDDQLLKTVCLPLSQSYLQSQHPGSAAFWLQRWFRSWVRSPYRKLPLWWSHCSRAQSPRPPPAASDPYCTHQTCRGTWSRNYRQRYRQSDMQGNMIPKPQTETQTVKQTGEPDPKTTDRDTDSQEFLIQGFCRYQHVTFATFKDLFKTIMHTI